MNCPTHPRSVKAESRTLANSVSGKLTADAINAELEKVSLSGVIPPPPSPLIAIAFRSLCVRAFKIMTITKMMTIDSFIDWSTPRHDARGANRRRGVKGSCLLPYGLVCEKVSANNLQHQYFQRLTLQESPRCCTRA